MMIYLSVTLLLDNLRPLLKCQAKTVSFVGIDTLFGLMFRVTRKGVSATGPSGPVAVLSPGALAESVLLAAEELAGDFRAVAP
ncbi:hypothetical protein [Streptomyces sp. NPDC002054]|uniref:hypothetical protein n=1 Tax=Streptomyces sp. NPDC002054 TaxID=3154663 RepID=UPI00332F8119